MNYFPEGYEPTSKDILCGRGKGNLRHEGNQYFMKIIRANLHRYTDAPKRIDKSLVVSLIVSSLKDEGYNFVRQDTKTHLWFTLTEPQVHEKTGHAIRDILKKNKGNVPAPANHSKQAIQATDEPDVVASQILSTALKVSKLVEKSKLDFAALSAAQQPLLQQQYHPANPNYSAQVRRTSVLRLFDNLSPEEPMLPAGFQFPEGDNFITSTNQMGINNNMQNNYDQPLPLDTRNSANLRTSDMMQVFDALSPDEEDPRATPNKRTGSSREFRRSELLQFLDFTEEELQEAERLGEERDAAMAQETVAPAAQPDSQPLPLDSRTSDTLNALFKDQEDIFSNLQNIFTQLPDDEDEKNGNNHDMEERNSRASQVLGELLKRQEGLFEEFRSLGSEFDVDL